MDATRTSAFLARPSPATASLSTSGEAQLDASSPRSPPWCAERGTSRRRVVVGSVLGKRTTAPTPEEAGGKRLVREDLSSAERPLFPPCNLASPSSPAPSNGAASSTSAAGPPPTPSNDATPSFVAKRTGAYGSAASPASAKSGSAVHATRPRTVPVLSSAALPSRLAKPSAARKRSSTHLQRSPGRKALGDLGNLANAQPRSPSPSRSTPRSRRESQSALLQSILAGTTDPHIISQWLFLNQEVLDLVRVLETVDDDLVHVVLRGYNDLEYHVDLTNPDGIKQNYGGWENAFMDATASKNIAGNCGQGVSDNPDHIFMCFATADCKKYNGAGRANRMDPANECIRWLKRVCKSCMQLQTALRRVVVRSLVGFVFHRDR